MTLQFNTDETIVYFLKEDNTLYGKGKCRSLEKATLYLISSFIEGLQDIVDTLAHMKSVLNSNLRCKREVYGTKHDYIAMMLHRLCAALENGTFIKQGNFSVEHHHGEHSYLITVEIKAIYYKQEFSSEKEALDFVKKLYVRTRIDKQTFLFLSSEINKGFAHEIGPYIIFHTTKRDFIEIRGRSIEKKVIYIEDALSFIFKCFIFNLIQKEEIHSFLQLLQRLNLNSRYHESVKVIFDTLHPDRDLNRIITLDNYIEPKFMKINIMCDQLVFQSMSIEVKPFFFKYATFTIHESYDFIKKLEKGNRISENRVFALKDRLITCLNNN